MNGSEIPKVVTKISVNEQLRYKLIQKQGLGSCLLLAGQTDTLKYPSLSLWLFLLSRCRLRALNRILGSCKTMLQIHVNMFFSCIRWVNMRLDLVLFSPSWLIWSYLANYWISQSKFLTVRFSNDHRSSGRKQCWQPTWGLTKIVPKCFKLAKLERSADFKMPVARRWWFQWALTGLDDCTVGKIPAGCFAVFSSKWIWFKDLFWCVATLRPTSVVGFPGTIGPLPNG